MRTTFSSNLSSVVFAGCLVLVAATGRAGQQPPPIGGVTGTIALEGTVEKTDAGINAIVVKTRDGIEHLLHLSGRTVVHGTKAADEQPLRGLEAGSRVVVHVTQDVGHYTVHEVDRVADDGLRTIEGVITHVDRSAKTISIRLADGSRQTLALTERAASDVGKDIDSDAVDAQRVVVYFAEEGGRPVAHFFKRIS